MSDSKDEPPQSPDIHFEPLVTLEPVEVKTNEEDETILFCERAKLYRFEKAADPPEWKERGTGEVKLLSDNESGKKRIVMRRDKTLKICCNHFVTSDMKLKPSVGSDKAWVWTTAADFADEVAKPENLAIRFKDATIACRFKDMFEADETVKAGNDESQDVTEKLEGLSVGEAKENDSRGDGDKSKDTSSNEATSESGIKDAGNDEATDKSQPEAKEKTPVDDQASEENVAKEASSSAEEGATVTAEN